MEMQRTPSRDMRVEIIAFYLDQPENPHCFMVGLKKKKF